MKTLSHTMLSQLGSNLTSRLIPLAKCSNTQLCVLFLLAMLLALKTQAASPFQPYASIIVDVSQVLHGGLKQNTTNRVLFDGGLEYSQHSHTLFVNYQALRGDNGSDSVGDIQAFSNIDEDEFSRLYEFYYQYSAEKWFIKLGKMDANAEFAIADPSGDFINSSMGFSPTIVGFPTYPSPALSVQIGHNFNSQWQIAAGIFAAASSSDFSEQFYVSELRYQLHEQSQIKIGMWHDTNAYDPLNPLATASQHQRGYYLISQTTLANRHWLSTENINWYNQLGYADENASEIQWHLGSGLEFTDVFSQAGHGLGLGISYVKLSRHLSTNHGSETALETYYFWTASDDLIIKPDLQYIINPSGMTERQNAFVFTLRFMFNF